MAKWYRKWLAGSGKDVKKIDLVGALDFTAAAGEGKRPTFKINAYRGGAMRVEAFFSPVVVDLAGLKAANKTMPILFNHDPSRVIGQADEIQITDKGVILSGTVTGEDGDAASVVAHAKNGFKWQASIGANVTRREFVESGKTVNVNGRNVSGPLIIAREAQLIETSILAIGADTTSSTKIAASKHGDTNMEFTQWLEAKGIDNFDELSKPIQDQLKAAYQHDANPDPVSDGDADEGAGASTLTAGNEAPDVKAMVADAVKSALSESRQQWETDQKRRNDIIAVTASHPEIQAKAIAEGWAKEKAELEVIKANRPNVSAFVRNGAASGVDQSDVLTASLCMSGGLSNLDKVFDEKVLEAAHRQYRGRIGLQQMLLTAAWAGGYTGHHFDKSATGMRDILKAAFSTLSLPGILSNTANKFLLQGFNAVETGWRAISAIRSVNDFKQITSYRLTGNFEFEELAKDGMIKHGSTGEQSFTNQARTYAKMYGITREDIINDDLGALTVVPQRIGRGGALKLNKVFWTEFMDNSSFFTAGNNNYFEGASTNLSVDSLTTGEQKFFDQTDPDGDPLGLTAATLLVPNALNVTATQLMRDSEVRDTTASKKYTTGNPHAGKFQVVRSSYLSNSTITGNSTTAWYLIADPMELPVIETVFLNGVEQPTVETADADFNQLGVQMRGYFDFGVSKQDTRAGVKSKGAA